MYEVPSSPNCKKESRQFGPRLMDIQALKRMQLKIVSTNSNVLFRRLSFMYKLLISDLLSKICFIDKFYILVFGKLYILFLIFCLD